MKIEDFKQAWATADAKHGDDSDHVMNVMFDVMSQMVGSHVDLLRGDLRRLSEHLRQVPTVASDASASEEAEV